MTEQALTKQLDVMELGNLLAKSGYFKDATDAAQAVVKVLAGQELGFGPVASMTGIHIIKGRVTLSANLIGAAVKRSGRYDYQVEKLDDTQCIITFCNAHSKIGTSSFSIEDAKRAGLLNGDNWKKYPRNMLFARALSNGAKWYCPDVFGGPVYTPDELGIPVDGETFEVVDVTPEPKPGWQPATKGETDDPNQETEHKMYDSRRDAYIARINELNGQLATPNDIDQTWLSEMSQNELVGYGQELGRAVKAEAEHLPDDELVGYGQVLARSVEAESEQVPDDMQGVE